MVNQEQHTFSVIKTQQSVQLKKLKEKYQQEHFKS